MASKDELFKGTMQVFGIKQLFEDEKQDQVEVQMIFI